MKRPRHTTTRLQAGEFRMGQDVLQAVAQGLHFFTKKQLSQLWRQSALPLQVLQDTPQVTQQLLRYRLTAKIPDHRAQLGMHMERQAMINAPDMAIFTAQAMAGFTV